MKRLRYFSFVFSTLVALSYIAFAFLAFVRYPTSYSPTLNWLSDLGSLDLNPKGAHFYNTGMIITGIFLIPFFLGLSTMKLEDNKVQNMMLFITQLFGLLGSLSMIMTALYPINYVTPHSFWSAGLYITIGTSFAFSVAASRYYPEWPKWLLLFGAITALSDMLISVFFNTIHVLEWITVSLFLVYCILLGVETKGLKSTVKSVAN